MRSSLPSFSVGTASACRMLATSSSRIAVAGFPRSHSAAQLAAAIVTQLEDRTTGVFAGTAFDSFGDLTPPFGQVDFRIYFFTGCEPLGA